VQVFDFERWATHRSSQRYLLHLIGIPKVFGFSTGCCNYITELCHDTGSNYLFALQSMLIRGLKVPLLCEFCFSSCVASWEAYKEVSTCGKTCATLLWGYHHPIWKLQTPSISPALLWHCCWRSAWMLPTVATWRLAVCGVMSCVMLAT